MKGDDVFGMYSDSESFEDKPVIIKSKARQLCMERDGMSEDEFDEHWDFNIAGSKGRDSYSVVDDELTLEQIQEITDVNRWNL